MKILVLSNMYPPHHLGGYELSCRDVVDRFRARGHHVTVLTTTLRVPGVSDPPGERAGGILRDLEFYWRDHELTSPPFMTRMRIERTNQRALQEALDEMKPDVVSVWNMGAMSFGLLTTIEEHGIPLVLNVCDEWPSYGPELDAWMRLFAQRPVFAHVVHSITRIPTRLPDLGQNTTFCFVSDYVKRHADERSRWSPQISPVVYSGIDTVDFPPEGKPEQPWRWRLLIVGRLDERKGIHVAIRALASLPGEAILDILGDGDPPYRAHLDALAGQCGVSERVRFGVAPREQLRARYTDADAVLFPVTWAEPFGLVPLEAMASGTPVIATGTGGSAEFLADRINCLIAPPGDDVALAAAVKELAGDHELRARLVRGGLATAKDLTVERLADVLEVWHRGAAERFASGLPPDRPSPVADRQP
jgi:glycosyltransferase involved in cell wall biosynthesis